MNGTPEKNPGATLAGATEQHDYGAGYKILRYLQRPFLAIGWQIEQACAHTEAKQELQKWNQHNQGQGQ